MKEFLFEVRTPEVTVIEEKVGYVCLPSTEGGYGVLANHAPAILWLGMGFCYYKQGEEKKRIFVMEGVAHVTGEKVTVLSDFAKKEDDLEEALKEREEYIAAEKKRRKEAFKEYKMSGVELMRAIERLSHRSDRI